MEKPSLNNKFIDYHALGMVKHLQKAGFLAYLVGGCVRDLLVGQIPKDFDIGTNALPPQVKKLLNFSFIIGRRFRLVLVKRGDRQYEVATFRREPKEGEFPEGVPFGDNIFGTPEEDARRRDFTCNAIFYDPVNEQLIDYVNGQKDLDAHVLRIIGDPKVRLPEDPIRILRGLRFAQKLRFRIEPELKAEMANQAHTLPTSNLARRREEYLKLLRLEDPVASFREGSDLGFWEHILPSLIPVYKEDGALDTFEERLYRLPERLVDSNDTTYLFGVLVLAWLRGTGRLKDEIIDLDKIRHDEKLAHFVKMELGMHNWEIAKLFHALGTQRTLADPDTFERKGHRRRRSLIQSESFPLAIDLAHADAVLAPDILEYWEGQVEPNFHVP